MLLPQHFPEISLPVLRHPPLPAEEGPVALDNIDNVCHTTNKLFPPPAEPLERRARSLRPRHCRWRRRAGPAHARALADRRLGRHFFLGTRFTHGFFGDEGRVDSVLRGEELCIREEDGRVERRRRREGEVVWVGMGEKVVRVQRWRDEGC